VETGDAITIHYDPMIAKIIAHGANRADAIRKLDAALADTVILGVTTNIPFLRDLLAHPAFQRGEVTTDFIEREFAAWQPRREHRDAALIAAALAETADHTGAEPASHRIDHDPWQARDTFRPGG